MLDLGFPRTRYKLQRGGGVLASAGGCGHLSVCRAWELLVTLTGLGRYAGSFVRRWVGGEGQNGYSGRFVSVESGGGQFDPPALCYAAGVGGGNSSML